MSRDHAPGRTGSGAAPCAAAPHAAVGKQTLVAAVQHRAEPSAPRSEPDAVKAFAAHGTSGPAGALPHLGRIQQLFGHHDVTGVRAHVGGSAAEGAGAMGAQAYATGDQVAFASAPDLHTAAHEAAHVVQQRAGVHLRGGVGQADDLYERHADAVADLVVQGKSADAMLDQHAGVGAPSAAVQRKGGGGSDRYAEARDLTNPNRGVEGQLVDKATVDFYAELLKDFSKESIAQARTDVPTAFVGNVHRRAHAILSFVAKGGVTDNAILALTLAAGNDDLLDDYLVFLPAFNTIARRGEVSNDRWPVLHAIRGKLTSDLLRTRAVAMTIGAETTEAARLELARTGDFGFVAQFVEHAETQATAHRDEVVSSGESEIAETAKRERAQAVVNQREAAFKTLTRRQREDIENGTNKSGGSGKRATEILAEQQQSLAEENDFPGINLQEQQKLTTLRDEVGPQAFATRKQEYQQWFSSVGYHDDALLALRAAKEEMTLASQIVSCLQAQPSTKALLLQSSLSVGQIKACLTLSSALLAGLVAIGISVDQFKAYVAVDKGVLLLGALQTAGVSGGRMQALVAALGKLTANIKDDPERAHLVTLLGGDDPAGVVGMFDACPGVAVGRLACLVTLRVKAQSTANLTTCLDLCTEAGWDRVKTVAVIGARGNGSTLLVLKQAIFTAIAGQYDKDSQFSSWLAAVGLLIEKDQMTIAHGAWNDLGIGNSGVRTWELLCNVQYVSDSSTFDSFVVHYHPGVSGASVGNTNASKAHLKPNRHIKNYKLDPGAAPGPVRALIELRP